MLPAVHGMKPGVFCFNPPYGVRMGAEAGEEQLLTLYSGMGRAFRSVQSLASGLLRREPALR